jgi:hypothetical protein
MDPTNTSRYLQEEKTRKPRYIQGKLQDNSKINPKMASI